MKLFRYFERSHHKRQFIYILMIWSLIMIVVMVYDSFNQINQQEKLALIQARIAFEKDIIYRKWVAMHGGVYVPVTDKTPPDPYLHDPERDITSPSGRKLTLINPAYMTRQVQELERDDSNLRGHITSLTPSNPENAPLKWEIRAIESFKAGEKEYREFTEINNLPYLRYMRPFYVEKACLKSHAADGYKINEIKGGLSILVPLDEMESISHLYILKSLGLYFLLWLIGISGLFIKFRFIDKQFTVIMEKEKELEKFKSAMDQVQDIVFIVLPENMEIIYANLFSEKICGFSVEKFASMPICNLFELPKEEPCLKYLKEKKMLAKLADGERNIVCKDGVLIPVEVKVDLFETKNDDQYIIVMARDISRRKELEAEREKLNTELLEAHKLEAVGQLAAGIAHEINTPTQYVGTNLDFFSDAFSDLSELIEKYQDVVNQAQKKDCLSSESMEELKEVLEEADWEYLKEEIPEAIRQSKEGVKRVTSIVRAMKNFSHPGSGVKELNDLNVIIETTVTISRNEWKYVSDVNLELDPDLPQVPCLSDHIGQTLLNIIVNAAHAIAAKQGDSPEDKSGLITIKTAKLDNAVKIVIQDTGKGMSEDIKMHIFEPFFTTKEVGKGTGQGLSIARDIVVDKHNGTIEVESEPGVGSKFIITLPLNESEPV